MNLIDLVLQDKPDLLKNQYDNLVVAFIREKYSQNEENAILRKKLANIDFDNEFDTYNAYVEQCKAKAKRQLNL